MNSAGLILKLSRWGKSSTARTACTSLQASGGRSGEVRLMAVSVNYLHPSSRYTTISASEEGFDAQSLLGVKGVGQSLHDSPCQLGIIQWKQTTRLQDESSIQSFRIHRAPCQLNIHIRIQVTSAPLLFRFCPCGHARKVSCMPPTSDRCATHIDNSCSICLTAERACRLNHLHMLLLHHMPDRLAR